MMAPRGGSRPRPPPSSSSSCAASGGSSHGNGGGGGASSLFRSRFCLIRLFITLVVLTIVLDFYFLVLSNQKVVSSRPLLLIHHHQHNEAGATATAAAISGTSDTATTTTTTTVTDDPVIALFNASGISLDAATIKRLPTWKQVTDLYGAHPVMAGFQPPLQSSQSSSAVLQAPPLSSFQASCTEYRARVPAERRLLGAAGMFSTGTNLITTLLKNNCQIPERVALYGPDASRELHGMRWQVPWGKHTPAHYKTLHAATHATGVNKDDVLPIVTIRHPYWWMHSMCKNPYTTRWHVKRRDACPDLRLEPPDNTLEKDDDLPWNNVTVKYGAGSEHYQSLVHLFNDWYHEYTERADYPWVSLYE
jgi:hypothetical protein